MILNNLPQQSAQEIELYNLYYLRDLLNLMQQNFDLLAAGDEGQRITVSGTNLYALAAQYYGDATYWNVIAQANQNVIKQVNDFIDPNIVGIVTLVLPPKPPQPTGGIYSA